MPLSDRRVQALVVATGAIATLAFLVSLINYVQAEELRRDQRLTIELLDGTEGHPGIIDLVEGLSAVESRIDANTADVAAYVAQLRARAAAGQDPRTARLFSLVEELARSHGIEVPPLELPPTTTTTTTG